ncbi:MAG TPA: hypothetical protein VFS59_16535 [Gemmatimonadaceae bacterium]|nr:hypothetical protein [Gemmatimonadaceae bacterium]
MSGLATAGFARDVGLPTRYQGCGAIDPHLEIGGREGVEAERTGTQRGEDARLGDFAAPVVDELKVVRLDRGELIGVVPA